MNKDCRPTFNLHQKVWRKNVSREIGRESFDVHERHEQLENKGRFELRKTRQQDPLDGAKEAAGIRRNVVEVTECTQRVVELVRFVTRPTCLKITCTTTSHSITENNIQFSSVAVYSLDQLYSTHLSNAPHNEVIDCRAI